MAGQLTIDTLKASSGVLATQNGMTGIAKAWVQFVSPSGVLTINSSFNVGSVTRNATGDYNINFTTAMPSINYAVVALNGGSSTNPPSTTASTPIVVGYNIPTSTTTQRICNMYAGGGAAYDALVMSVAIFSS